MSSTCRSRFADSEAGDRTNCRLRHRGGHILHLVCDLSIAAENARFGQTGPKVGSFDGGYGSSLLARTIGVKRAKEIWFLCRQYDANQALEWGLVNTVVALDQLENETVAWCRQILTLSPIALRMLKAGFNAAEDGMAGIQQLAGTRPCSSTCPKRARRVATPSSNTASRIFRSFPSVHERGSRAAPALGARGASAHVARGDGAGRRGRRAHSTAHDQLG